MFAVSLHRVRQPANPFANAACPLVSPGREARSAESAATRGGLGMEGKDERGIAHPNVETSIVAQDGGWRNETTTPGEEVFTRCMETGRGR